MGDYVILLLENELPRIEEGIQKIILSVEGLREKPFATPEEFMLLYTCIYNLCTQRPPHDYSEQLYAFYKDTITKHVTGKVLPSLQREAPQQEALLQQLRQQWQTHKAIVKKVSGLFKNLNNYYLSRHKLPNLQDVGYSCFMELVYDVYKEEGKAALLALVGRQREAEGGRIDGAPEKERRLVLRQQERQQRAIEDGRERERAL